MNRMAVFVDAGYLFAQGSAAIAGETQSRTCLKLDIDKVLGALRELAASRARDTPLLRIYWYDGISPKGGRDEQEKLAYADDVKLRLGLINKQGKQKGVDALIITDMIELARNRAISDALLLSGDEDVRIGVLVAQSFGVRVHLLGIVPCRGSQSRHLRQEADTLSEWDADTVRQFLEVVGQIIRTDAPAKKMATADDVSLALNRVATDYANALGETAHASLKAALSAGPAIPPDFDRPLLAKARDEVGRQLEPDEKRELRDAFRVQVNGHP